MTGENSFKNYCNNYGCSADIAEGGYLLCKLCKLDLERSFSCILLHLKSKLSEEGLISDHLDLHVTVASADDRTSVGVVFVKKILDVIFFAFYIGDLLGFLGLAVESCLIDLDLALHDDTVSGDLVARLKIYKVAHYDLADMYLHELAVTEDLCHLLGLFLRLESLSLVFLLIFTDGGHSVCDQYCDKDTHRLEPFGLPHKEQHYLHYKGNEEYHDHRVGKTDEDLFPQRIRWDLSKVVGTVLLTALFDLFCRQTFEFHNKTPFFSMISAGLLKSSALSSFGTEYNLSHLKLYYSC